MKGTTMKNRSSFTKTFHNITLAVMLTSSVIIAVSAVVSVAKSHHEGALEGIDWDSAPGQ